MRRALITIVLLILALATGVRWLLTSGALTESVRARVVDEASRALGREVRVDRLSGDPLRGIVLHGVQVASPPGVATGPFFSSPRLTVFFDVGRLLRDLASRRGIASSIIRVDVDRPLLLLARDAKGLWNYEDLVARQQGAPPAPAFRGQVNVHEGSFVFSDALRLPQVAGPRPPSPFAAHFDRVTGTLDFGPSPTVGLVLDAVNTDGKTPALLRVSGKATLGAATFDLDLVTRGGSVAYWGPYLVRLPWLVWGGGTFDGTMHLLASPWGRDVVLDYRGALVMRDGKALLLPQKTLLSDIDGPLEVDSLGVTTGGLTMAVDASPLWVRGIITHHAGVYLDLALRTGSLDLRTLQTVLFPHARLRLAGSAGAEARIVGPFGSPRLEGEIRTASGRVNRLGFANLSSRFSYYGGVLVFDDLRAASAGGALRGHLRANLDEGSLFILADAAGVDARLFPGLALTANPYSLQGRADGFIAAAVQPSGVVALGRVEMGRGQLFGVGFDRLDTLVGYDHGRVDVDRLDARSGPTRLSIFGLMAPAGALNFSLFATDVNLRTVERRFGLQGWLSGTADVRGRIEGSLRDPILVGTVRGRAGALGPFPYDQARGRIRLTTAGLMTPGMILFDGSGRYFAAGSLRWAAPARVDLTARANNVPVQRLLEIAQVPLHLTGTVESTVALTGSLRAPQAEGVAVLREGSVEGQPIDRAEAAFRWTGSALLVDRFTARVNSSTLDARGSVHRSGRIALTFSAGHLDLADVALLRNDVLAASGTVDVTGTLAGTIDVPSAVTTVSSRNLTLNGQTFTSAEGIVRYRRGQLQFAPLILRQDGGSFRLDGSVSLRADPVVGMQIVAEHGELATLMGLARVRTPFALGGTVDGTFTAAGPLSNPRASLEFILADGRIGDHAVREATVRADLANRAVNLRTFHVVPDQGELIGAGRIDLRGSSEVEFTGTGLSLDLLRPLFGIRRPLGGNLDFTVQLTGRVSDPVVGLSASATQGAIGGTAFDRITVQAFYRNGQFNVEHGLLQENRHRVRLTGTVPFNPARLRFDEAQPVNLQLELVDADLSILTLLTDWVERADGPVAGAVTITGTVGHPHLDGSVTASNGTIQLRGIAPALSALSGQLTFSEDEVRVGSLTARAGDGTVRLSGTVSLRTFRPDRLALQLTAERASLTYTPFFAGTAEGTLRIGGTAARPEISGTATLSGGDLAVAVVERLPQRGPEPGGFANPALDVELQAGEGLWVSVGGLRLLAHGAVHATGTWLRPRLAGEVTADRGTFTAFNNTFTLTDARATFAEFRSTTPFIDATAETRISIPRPALTGTGGRIETVRVFMHITGTPEALNLALSSDPPLPREEILAGLGRQVGLTRLFTGERLEDVLRAELINALFNPFSQAVARVFGLEEFTIAYDFVRPLTLRIGKLLISNLYLTLTSEFGTPRRTVWALEYRLSPSTMFAFSVDNLGVWDVLYRITYRF